jgi:pimeloyl-ACP methyl ester carboxylesterase
MIHHQKEERTMPPSISARRRFLWQATGLAGLFMPGLRATAADGTRLPLLRLQTDTIDFAYHTAGPENGRPVVLVHDFAYDIHSFKRVVPILADAGMRVLLPFQRGHGGTRFRDDAAPRSGQQAALGKDLIEFIDVLHIPEAVFAGFGWGAHAAYAASVVRPTRCVGLVLAGLERIDAAGPFERYLFQSNTGRRELERDPRGVARTLWQRLSPASRFDAGLFASAAPSFDNPEFGAILAHAWGYRHEGAAGDPRYKALEKKFARQPTTGVAAITMAGAASGTGDAAGPAIAFTGAHDHRELDGVGHHLPFEAPQAFAAAALELARNGKWRT